MLYSTGHLLPKCFKVLEKQEIEEDLIIRVVKSLSNFLLLSHFFYCVGCMVQSNFHFCVWNSGKFITTSNINVNDVFLGFLLLTLNIFLTLFWCFIIDFKQVNSGWVCVFIDEAKAKINTFVVTPFAMLTLALS